MQKLFYRQFMVYIFLFCACLTMLAIGHTVDMCISTQVWIETDNPHYDIQPEVHILGKDWYYIFVFGEDISRLDADGNPEIFCESITEQTPGNQYYPEQRLCVLYSHPDNAEHVWYESQPGAAEYGIGWRGWSGKSVPLKYGGDVLIENWLILRFDTLTSLVLLSFYAIVYLVFAVSMARPRDPLEQRWLWIVPWKRG